MKSIKLVLALLVALPLGSALLRADEAKKPACCEQAAKDGKACEKACCKESAKESKGCEKCAAAAKDTAKEKH